MGVSLAMLVSQYIPHYLKYFFLLAPQHLPKAQWQVAWMMYRMNILTYSERLRGKAALWQRLLRKKALGNSSRLKGVLVTAFFFFFSIITKHNTKVHFYNFKVSVGVLYLLFVSGKTREHQHRHGAAWPVYPLTVPCFLQVWHHSCSFQQYRLWNHRRQSWKTPWDVPG